MKICKECKESKSLSGFPKDKRMKDGTTNICTKCIGKRYAIYRRDWEVRKNFGISLQEYNKLKTACVICDSENNLHLDHSHKTKQLRGFLCVNCNMGIGQFKENIANMKRAIQYLETYSNG